MKEIKYTKNFYSMFDGMYSKKKFAVPRAPENFDCLDLPIRSYQAHWVPIIFKKLKEEGPLPDYVCTDICGRICSPKLKDIIQQHLTEADNEIQWLPMLIEDEETGEKVEYYYLHFPEVCDTLDLKYSTFSEHSSLVRKAVFSYEKIKKRSIFNCQNSRLITACSKKLKEEIFKSDCTGLSVEPAHVIQVIDESQVS